MSLVALCFVAVLAISLASYIAVCSRAMQLSNRSFQASVSQQLAEAGIEEALRAFNQNNWEGWSANPSGISGGTTAWTLDTTNKRATRTITFDSTKLGQGTTATLKLRVDNYDANVVGVSWSSSKSYRIGELAGHNGGWYRCVKNHSNQTPAGLDNLAYWVPAPIPWKWQSNVSYSSSDVVNYDGTWYRCTASHTSPATWTGTNWTAIGAIASHANSLSSHSAGDVYYKADSNTWYRWNTSGNSSTSDPQISWQYKSWNVYRFDDLVCYYAGSAYNWYRSITSSSSGVLPTDPTKWENALAGNNSTSNPGVHGWSSSGIKYNIGDSVYYGVTDQWYRCIRAHTSSNSLTPASTTNWTNTPLYSFDWDSTKQYSQNDTVRYNGVWHISIHSGTGNISQNPSTATSYWIGADTSNTSYTWDSSTNYSVGAYRCYGGIWYLCIKSGNTGKSPNNAEFWTASWENSWKVNTGAPVIYAEVSVTLTGSDIQRTQLRASISPASLFPNAAAATTTISANSGGTVDSYDSNKGTYSSQIGSSTNYSAVLAAGSTITLGSTTVKGYLAWPSPPSGIGTSASVKGLTSPASPNVDPSRINRSPYIPQFTTQPGGADGLAANWATTPKGTALTLYNTVNIGTPGATAPSRYYYNGTLTIGNSTVTNLKINGPVILYINGDLNITSSSGYIGRIDIHSAGSAEIHLAGVFKADAGSEGILNYTTNPKSLVIISDTSSTASHYYSEGVNPLYGVIYIPYSTSNGGYYNNNNNTHVYGAISANKITYSGANLNLHYDTSLRYATIPGVDQPWTATEWRELPVTEQATMP